MDHRELADLYARCGHGLFRRCLAYLGSEAEAQDAVQEVFARAVEAAGRYRSEGQPAAWLRRIADHHCVDLLRRRRRNPVRLDEDGDGPAPEPFDRFGGPRPDHLIAVHRLLRALEPEAARLAVLYYLDGLTQEELAESTGLSRRTIGKRLAAIVVVARGVVAAEGGA